MTLPVCAALFTVSSVVPAARAQVVIEVRARNFEFDPPEVVIQQGDTIRWVWEGGDHTVTEGDFCAVKEPLFDALLNAENPEFDFAFEEIGTYDYLCIPHCNVMLGEVVVLPIGAGLDSAPASLDGFVLLGAFPNPVRAEGEIAFRLPKTSWVRLSLHSVDGRRVRELIDGVLPAGVHRASWDGRDSGGLYVATGSYRCRLEAPGISVVRSLLLLR